MCCKHIERGLVVAAEQKIQVLSESGAIKTIALPPSWQHRLEHRSADGRVVSAFIAPDSPAVEFCIYRRPSAISQEAGASFLRVLVAPFHELTGDEIESLDILLESMAKSESFDLRSASTGYLNGKRILRVEGFWKLLGTKTIAVFTNEDDAGCIVQAIYYSAPDALFEKFLPEASAAFQSVEWM
jgi:hypothetical protein